NRRKPPSMRVPNERFGAGKIHRYRWRRSETLERVSDAFEELVGRRVFRTGLFMPGLLIARLAARYLVGCADALCHRFPPLLATISCHSPPRPKSCRTCANPHGLRCKVQWSMGFSIIAPPLRETCSTG